MTAYTQLLKRIKEPGILASIGELLGWDEEVMMPTGAIQRRALEKGILASLSHRLATSPQIGKLLEATKKEKLTEEQQAMIREIKFDYERAKNVPEKLVKELEETTTHAVEAWKKARAQNNFSLFVPHLKKIIELKKQEANAINPARNPYGVLVEGYESGISVKEMQKVFEQIKPEMVSLIIKIKKAKKINTSFLNIKIQEETQKKFNQELAKYIGYDFSKGRIDTSTHPFTACYGRITTRYTDGFVNTIISTMHEAGHAFYEHGLLDEQFGTPFGESRSLSVHESQSRFWENHIGKSKDFWKNELAKLTKKYAIKNISLEEFYKAINLVEPGLIRVNADEVTYTMHIILRFELEAALIEGKINVEDLSAIWNKKMKQYLGVTVPNDSKGVLQDIHWASGLIGYFPTYTMGSIIASQLFAAAVQDIKGLNEKIIRGDFKQLHNWLQNKIHKHGRRYTTKELVKLATGEEPNPRAYLAYLQKKFGEIYNI